jgi:hypothetical protein
MTHDELLAKIDRYAEYGYDFELVRALRAVVELHRPMAFGTDGAMECVCCEANHQFPNLYPCLTIQAIEKKLK